jgi:hypothetical protein
LFLPCGRAGSRFMPVKIGTVRVLSATSSRQCLRRRDAELSNPPYQHAMEAIEHAFAIGFDVVIFLLKLSFLCTADRFERLHKPGHLRRLHVLAERLQDMHDAAHLAAGGDKAGQSQNHAWFVFDRHYCGPAAINPVSINKPAARMPWANGGRP